MVTSGHRCVHHGVNTPETLLGLRYPGLCRGYIGEVDPGAECLHPHRLHLALELLGRLLAPQVAERDVAAHGCELAHDVTAQTTASSSDDDAAIFQVFERLECHWGLFSVMAQVAMTEYADRSYCRIRKCLK